MVNVLLCCSKPDVFVRMLAVARYSSFRKTSRGSDDDRSLQARLKASLSSSNSSSARPVVPSGRETGLFLKLKLHPLTNEEFFTKQARTQSTGSQRALPFRKCETPEKILDARRGSPLKNDRGDSSPLSLRSRAVSSASPEELPKPQPSLRSLLPTRQIQPPPKQETGNSPTFSRSDEGWERSVELKARKAANFQLNGTDSADSEANEIEREGKHHFFFVNSYS